VTVLLRSSSTYRAPNQSVATITTDFTSFHSLHNALKGKDAVLCCLSGSALHFDKQKLLIDAAISAGVKFFFASEFVSDILSEHFATFPPEFVGDKIKVRSYLEEKGRSGEIAWTGLNGGPFFDMCKYLPA
jgi:hypothetical protein